MEKKECLSGKLQLLEPEENTIVSYKEIETRSLERLKEFLLNGDDTKYNAVAARILSQINKLRSTMKSQISVRVSIFKNIAEDKEEFKSYINISFPHLKNSIKNKKKRR